MTDLSSYDVVSPGRKTIDLSSYDAVEAPTKSLRRKITEQTIGRYGKGLTESLGAAVNPRIQRTKSGTPFSENIPLIREAVPPSPSALVSLLLGENNANLGFPSGEEYSSRLGIDTKPEGTALASLGGASEYLGALTPALLGGGPFLQSLLSGAIGGGAHGAVEEKTGSPGLGTAAGIIGSLLGGGLGSVTKAHPPKSAALRQGSSRLREAGFTGKQIQALDSATNEKLRKISKKAARGKEFENVLTGLDRNISAFLNNIEEQAQHIKSPVPSAFQKRVVNDLEDLQKDISITHFKGPEQREAVTAVRKTLADIRNRGLTPLSAIRTYRSLNQSRQLKQAAKPKPLIAAQKSLEKYIKSANKQLGEDFVLGNEIYGRKAKLLSKLSPEGIESILKTLNGGEIAGALLGGKHGLAKYSLGLFAGPYYNRALIINPRFQELGKRIRQAAIKGNYTNLAKLANKLDAEFPNEAEEIETSSQK